MLHAYSEAVILGTPALTLNPRTRWFVCARNEGAAHLTGMQRFCCQLLNVTVVQQGLQPLKGHTQALMQACCHGCKRELRFHLSRALFARLRAPKVGQHDHSGTTAEQQPHCGHRGVHSGPVSDLAIADWHIEVQPDKHAVTLLDDSILEALTV